MEIKEMSTDSENGDDSKMIMHLDQLRDPRHTELERDQPDVLDLDLILFLHLHFTLVLVDLDLGLLRGDDLVGAVVFGGGLVGRGEEVGLGQDLDEVGEVGQERFELGPRAVPGGMDRELR